MSNKIISGGRTAKDIARSYLDRQTPANSGGEKPTPAPLAQPVNPPSPAIAVIQGDFVYVPASAFPDELKKHYMQPSLDWDLQNGLYVAKKKLQKTSEVIEIGKKLGIDLESRTDSYGFLGRIDWYESKQIVEQGLGARILTPALYFPILKWAEANDAELAKDLSEYAEWLDAVTKEGAKNKPAEYLVHPDKDLNGGQDYGMVLIPKDEHFDYTDINLLSGLPMTFRDKGKFKQWYPEQSPTAVIRDGGSDLVLLCFREPSFVDVSLGVRVAKFF